MDKIPDIFKELFKYEFQNKKIALYDSNDHIGIIIKNEEINGQKKFNKEIVEKMNKCNWEMVWFGNGLYLNIYK